MARNRSYAARAGQHKLPQSAVRAKGIALVVEALRNYFAPVGRNLWVYLFCGMLMAAIVGLELEMPLGVAVPVLYSAVVLLSFRARQKKFIMLVALLASILTLAPLLWKPPIDDMWKAVFNRSLGMFSIWLTVLLGFGSMKLAERRANFDELTGLPNRALFFDRLDQAMIHARRKRSRCALLYVDLDGFKMVNDNHGHQVGDELLQAAARQLTSCVRESNTVARMGGDEFIIILNDFSQWEGPGIVARRLLEAFATPFSLGEIVCRIGVSIGVSIYPNDAEDAQELISCADAAMYQVKRSGKNNFRYCSES